MSEPRANESEPAMTPANENQPANDERETMSIGDAAAMLHLSVAQVRKLCKLHERKPDEGLAFAWSSPWVPRTDVNGHRLRGHRMPYRDAVETLAAAKQEIERGLSS